MIRTADSSRSIVVHLAAAAALAAATLVAGCFNVTAPAGSRDACTKAGGLCVPLGDCTPAGGAPSMDCFIEGVDASECCMGTTPKPMATTCADQGGLCVPFPDCPGGDGYVSIKDSDCGGRSDVACCIPRGSCGGDPLFQCCNTHNFILDEVRCDEGMQTCGPTDTKVEFYAGGCMR